MVELDDISINSDESEMQPDAAPPAIATWKLYTAVLASDAQDNVDANTRPHQRAAHERWLLLTKMHDMGQTICSACSGHGHQKKQCPTMDRLTFLSKVCPRYV